MNKYTMICAGICLAIAGLMSACNKEDYPVYDTTQKDAVYVAYGNSGTTDSIHYEYGFRLETEVTLRIPVKLMGMPVNRERAFDVKVVDSLTTMTEEVHYSIPKSGLILPANQLEGSIGITLYRDKDPKLTDTTYIISIELTETEDLKPVQGQLFFQITYSDRRPSTPRWWLDGQLGEYNFEVAQWFFHYFYLTQESHPAIFNEIVAKYGDYFVEAGPQLGPLVNYDNFFAKYVLTPLYEQYKDHPDIRIPKPSVH